MCKPTSSTSILFSRFIATADNYSFIFIGQLICDGYSDDFQFSFPFFSLLEGFNTNNWITVQGIVFQLIGNLCQPQVISCCQFKMMFAARSSKNLRAQWNVAPVIQPSFLLKKFVTSNFTRNILCEFENPKVQGFYQGRKRFLGESVYVGLE